MIKKCESSGIKCKYCNCFLEYINFKDDLIEYKYLCCKKNYQQKFDEKLKERFLIHVNFLTIVYEWLGNVQWNIITWKRIFLQSLKYGRYFWYRLCACTNSL